MGFVVVEFLPASLRRPTPVRGGEFRHDGAVHLLDSREVERGAGDDGVAEKLDLGAVGIGQRAVGGGGRTVDDSRVTGRSSRAEARVEVQHRD